MTKYQEAIGAVKHFWVRSFCCCHCLVEDCPGRMSTALHGLAARALRGGAQTACFPMGCSRCAVWQALGTRGRVLNCPAGAAQGQVVGSSAIRISWGRSSTASRGPAAIAAAAAALGAPAYPYPSVGVVPAAPGMPSFCLSGPYLKDYCSTMVVN